MEWKTIRYCDRYEISDTAVIRDKKTGHTLSGHIKRKRRSVRLIYPDGRKRKFFTDRLVAEHFCENDDPQHKTFVAHIDRDPLNDKAVNLEWWVRRDWHQMLYEEVQARVKAEKQPHPIPVNVYAPDGNFVGTFPSLKKASEAINVKVKYIADVVVKGKADDAEGYRIVPLIEGSTTKREKPKKKKTAKRQSELELRNQGLSEW